MNFSPEQLLEVSLLANKELQKRKLENSFIEYVKYAFKKKTGKDFILNWHHEVICETMEKVFRGEIKRLIINIPPRYSKTELAVKMFMEWCFAKVPESKFIHLSYSDSLALDNSSEVRESIKADWYQEFWDIKIKRDSDAKQKWFNSFGGGVYATGTAGSITGFGAGSTNNGYFGAIILDDPIKPTEAHSKTFRDKINGRLNNTIVSRLNNPKETPIIIIMQRLHEEDMTGFCLDGGTGDKWHHLKISVLDEKDQPLWPTKHDAKQIEKLRKSDPYMFAGQYMQEPSPIDGEFFKRQSFDIIDYAPSQGTIVRAWDFASSISKTADYTVGLKMSKFDGIYYIQDVIKFKGTPFDVEKTLLQTAKLDGYNCPISFPTDPGQAGKAQAANFIKLLAGYMIETTPETGSKETRATAFASQVEAGNVKLVKGDWNKDFIEEMILFPNGKHDDQVDACSRAFFKLHLMSAGNFSNKFSQNNISIISGASQW